MNIKRRSYLISFIIILTVILAATFTAFATSAQETALSTGDRNVEFSNGYYGFCLDPLLHGAYSGDTFASAGGTSAALSNKDNSDISQYLKVLFTQCFEDLFVPDGNGGYQVKDTNTIQAIVWHFTDGQWVSGEKSRLVNLVKAYTGPAIPDEGYTLQLDNGDIITFYFTVMIPDNSEVQYFFAYKIVVGQTPSHVHDYDKDWSFDENEHWHECECGDKKDREEHVYQGGVCIECDTVDPDGMPPKTSDDLEPCFQLALLLLSIGGATWAVRTKKRHQS